MQISYYFLRLWLGVGWAPCRPRFVSRWGRLGALLVQDGPPGRHLAILIAPPLVDFLVRLHPAKSESTQHDKKMSES